MSVTVREQVRSGVPRDGRGPAVAMPGTTGATGTTAGGTSAGIEIGIEVDRCVGCLACATVCKSEVLRLMPGAWAVEADAEACTACRRCVGACPFGAIAVTGSPRNRRRIVVDRVRSSLRATCPTGWTVLGDGPAFRAGPGAAPVTPDVAVVRTAVPGLEWLAVDEVVVPLVVDVVSSSVTPEQLESRRELYWRCGVTTYWTVDQRTGAVSVEWSSRSGWFDGWAGFTFA